MFHFFSQNEFTPKRFANLAAGGNGPSSQGSQPVNPEQNRTPRAGAEQQGNDALTHVTDAVRERILELKPNELLSEDEQNESPQELVTRLKDLSKVPDSKIYEWYAGKYSDVLSGTAITQQMKDKIRSKEIERFKDLVGIKAAKELDVIIAASPKPKKYSDALFHLKNGIGNLDTYSTKKLFIKLEKDSREAAKEEVERSGESEAEQRKLLKAIDDAPSKIGFEAEQYVLLLQKKIELEQKLKDDLPKIAEIDAEIKALKESENTIDEKKERYIDWKRKWLMIGLKTAGYLSLTGGWLGAMSGLTGIGVSMITSATGVTDIGFLKGLGIGATWLFQTGYRTMKGIEEITGVGLFSQIGIAALTLIPVDYGIKKIKQVSARWRHDAKQKLLDSKRENRLKVMGIEDTEKELTNVKNGLDKYKKINSERAKLLIGQKKHYEIIQDDYIKKIDDKRKKGTQQDIADITELQTKLETVSKTILSLESFISLFSVSEGNRAERVMSLPVLNPENITSNIQAMEDKLEPQLTQNLYLLAQREQTRLVQQQAEAKNIAKRKTFKEELNALNENTAPSKERVREFFKKISDRQEFDTAEITQNQNLSNDLERKSHKTARIIKILLELPRTLFRKQVADTVLNIMDMPDQEGGQAGQAPAAPGGAPGPAGSTPAAPGGAPSTTGSAPSTSGAPASVGQSSGATGGSQTSGTQPEAPQSGDAQGTLENNEHFTESEARFIAERFSYGNKQREEETYRKLLNGTAEQNVVQYGKVLLNLDRNHHDELETLVSSLLHRSSDLILNRLKSTPIGWDADSTWAYWDICKQWYFWEQNGRNEGMSGHYHIANPLTNAEKQQEMIDLTVGCHIYIVYAKSKTHAGFGNVWDDINQELQATAPDLVQKLVDYINQLEVKDPNLEPDRHLHSYQYIQIGKLVREGLSQAASAGGGHQGPPDETQDLTDSSTPLSPEDQNALEDLQNEKAYLESAIEELTAALEDTKLSENDKNAISEELSVDKKALDGVKARIQQLITPEA